MEYLLTPNGIVRLPLEEIVRKLAYSLDLDTHDAIDTLIFAEDLVEVTPDQFFVPYHLRSEEELRKFFEGEVEISNSCML